MLHSWSSVIADLHTHPLVLANINSVILKAANLQEFSCAGCSYGCLWESPNFFLFKCWVSTNKGVYVLFCFVWWDIFVPEHSSGLLTYKIIDCKRSKPWSGQSHTQLQWNAPWCYLLSSDAAVAPPETITLPFASLGEAKWRKARMGTWGEAAWDELPQGGVWKPGLPSSVSEKYNVRV